jgi:hypothetical protein
MSVIDFLKSPFAWATGFFGALGLQQLVPFLTANAGTLFAGWSLFSIRILPSLDIDPATQQQLILIGAGAYLVFLVRRLWLRWRTRTDGGTA